ncbi:hypothetical protein [Streptomyces coerulescens]|uniref:Uncharacterized protein n=1 Tax=Streptomyces coerulescens TaxID=29304 RepID=A0ABW0CQB5_STRCD
MEQSTQPTAPTAPPKDTSQDAIRASYQRARTLADRLIGLGQVIPTAVEIYRYLGADDFSVRLHFGTGLDSGRGLLALAARIDAEPARDDQRGDVVWVETEGTVDGVQVIARALLNTADADLLLPRSDTPPAAEAAETAVEVTQPIPAVSTNPGGVPAITPVAPLSAVHTPASPAQGVSE